jgi:DNA-binding transcriptional LysR family regulator
LVVEHGATIVRGTEFAELEAFLAVTKERSFRRAASRLGFSPSALSHTIRELEERLGARLLNRTTRSVSPTEAGLALFNRIEPAIAEIESAVGAFGVFQLRPSGRLRLNLPQVAADLILAPVLGRFVQAYPDIRLELTIDDALTDVVAEGFDAGIRNGERLQQDMIAVRLTPNFHLAIVGSPLYFVQREALQTPRDLKDHACITYRWAATGAVYRWPLNGPDGPIHVAVEGPLVVNDLKLILAAALGGAGLACLPDKLVTRHIETGRLVPVLQAWCGPISGFFLYYPSHRHTPIALRAFIDFLRSDSNANNPSGETSAST